MSIEIKIPLKAATSPGFAFALATDAGDEEL